ncbi:MAG: hypothetical protein AB7P40_30325 [Chloroflexota bacterium]
MDRKLSRRSAHRQGSRIWLSGALTVGFVGLLALAAALWFGGGGAGQPVQTDPDAPGRLIAQADTVDLGLVPFSRQAEAQFTLANTGGSPVRLVGAPRVRMLAGC